MFKIEPIQDKSRQKELCEIFGIEYDELSFGYYMYDYESKSPMGISQFEINGNSGYIKDLCEFPGLNDTEAMFILGRQTMNFIDLCGAHKCKASVAGTDNSLLKAIGFTLNDDEFFADMTGFFDGSRCGGH